MKTWHSKGCEKQFLKGVFPTLALAAIFLGMGMMWRSAALATEPLLLNYRTISAVEQSDPPGTTVFTMELIVINNGTSAFQNVTVTAVSIADPATNYGSVTVGDLPVGSSQTVNGKFTVPDSSIDNMTFRIDHS